MLSNKIKNQLLGYEIYLLNKVANKEDRAIDDGQWTMDNGQLIHIQFKRFKLFKVLIHRRDITG